MVAGMRVIAGLVIGINLAACVSSTPVPVHSDGRGIREPVGEYRVVVPGDTLFSIAWESGRDYRQLAEWNNIDASFLIKPGQKIRLHPPATQAPAGSSEQSPSRYRVTKGDTIYSIARRYGLSPAKLAAANNIHPPYRIFPGQHLSLRNKSRDLKSKNGRRRQAAVKQTQHKPDTRTTKSYRGKWLWPTDGKLIGRYTGKGKKKGIEISGRRGQTIKAAAGGKVVYQGSGLRGYGLLIILKHDDDYLSAYAHCENIYAKEGDVIQQGSRIATMGDSGTDRVKLHFEIRYKGNPVNPLKFLSHR